MVGDGRLAGGRGEQVVVPARPGATAAGQQALVVVQDCLVGRERERAEQLALPRRGVVAEDRERLVGVDRQDDVVVALGHAAARRDHHVVVGPDHTVDGRAQADRVAERRRQRLDVALGATLDHPPLRPLLEVEHPVVVEELDQEARGERPHLLRVGRPHRGGLRDDQPLDERVAEARVAQPLRQRRILVGGQQRAGLALEAPDVEHHLVEGGRRQVRALGEQAVRRRAGVLEVPVLVADAEAHVRRLGGDAEPVEQPLEVGVVAVVEHDEPGVDVERGVRLVDADGVRVAAGVPAASKTDRSCPARCRRWAATRPETPAPMTAILTMMRSGHAP